SPTPSCKSCIISRRDRAGEGADSFPSLWRPSAGQPHGPHAASASPCSNYAAHVTLRYSKHAHSPHAHTHAPSHSPPPPPPPPPPPAPPPPCRPPSPTTSSTSPSPSTCGSTSAACGPTAPWRR